MNLHLVTRAGRPLRGFARGPGAQAALRVSAPPVCCMPAILPHRRVADRRESLIGEMLVEGEALADFQTAHDFEAHAVDKTQVAPIGHEQSRGIRAVSGRRG